MRRTVLGLAGLAAGTTLLVVVKGAAASGPAAPSPVLAGPTAEPPSGMPPAPSAGPAAPAPETPSASPSGDAAPSARPSRSAPAAGPTRTGAAPAPTRTTAAPPPATGPYRVTGPVASNDYGAVQVQITMSGDRITEIRTLEMPESSSRSSQLSARAEPLLKAEALREQGADLDTVSGATYTSQSYRESLQGALDAAARGERG
ncbi:FMN-binding protein [Polymorphospora rubra]|uniref:FMN-binding protein n=1 Tax=Polymorphospora rubra TaxID=338584 RepID=UPI0033E71E07